MEIVQIFLLDKNLHILFGQERVSVKSLKLAHIRKPISEALHNESYSHLIPIEDGLTIAFKPLTFNDYSIYDAFIVLIGRNGNTPPKNLILLNALLDDCCTALSVFFGSKVQPDWLNKMSKVIDIER